MKYILCFLFIALASNCFGEVMLELDRLNTFILRKEHTPPDVYKNFKESFKKIGVDINKVHGFNQFKEDDRTILKIYIKGGDIKYLPIDKSSYLITFIEDDDFKPKKMLPIEIYYLDFGEIKTVLTKDEKLKNFNIKIKLSLSRIDNEFSTTFNIIDEIKEDKLIEQFNKIKPKAKDIIEKHFVFEDIENFKIKSKNRKFMRKCVVALNELLIRHGIKPRFHDVLVDEVSLVK